MNIMRSIHLRLLSTTILGVLAPMILVMGSHTAQAAVVYCKYIGVPKGCVVRPGVVLVPAPVVARAGGPRARWSPRRWSARWASGHRASASAPAPPSIAAAR